MIHLNVKDGLIVRDDGTPFTGTLDFIHGQHYLGWPGDPEPASRNLPDPPPVRLLSSSQEES